MNRDLTYVTMAVIIVFGGVMFTIYGTSAEKMVVELNETILDRNETIQGQVDQLNIKNDRIDELEDALRMSLKERTQWVVMDYHNDLEECEARQRRDTITHVGEEHPRIMPFKQGMTLHPGQSAYIDVEIPSR